MPDNFITQSYSLAPNHIRTIRDKAHAMDTFSRSDALRAIIDEWISLKKIITIGTISKDGIEITKKDGQQ